MRDYSPLDVIPLFEDLPENEHALLEKALERRSYAEGVNIMRESQPGSEVFFIVNGSVRVSINDDEAQELIITDFEGGDFFGEIAILTGSARSANVVALEDCEFLVLSKDRFEEVLKTCPGFTCSLLRELALRLRASTAKMGEFALLDVKERLMKYLVTTAVRGRVDGKDVDIIERLPSHREIAARLGTAREVVTRSLRALERDGKIRTDGKVVTLAG